MERTKQCRQPVFFATHIVLLTKYIQLLVFVYLLQKIITWAVFKTTNPEATPQCTRAATTTLITTTTTSLEPFGSGGGDKLCFSSFARFAKTHTRTGGTHMVNIGGVRGETNLKKF